jgi:hypothetical protein
VSRMRDLAAAMDQRTTEELVSILRSNDLDEWRPEVFVIVAGILRARGVSPEEVTALGPEPVSEPKAAAREPQAASLVTVAEFPNGAIAQSVAMALEEAGIEVWVTDQVQSYYGVGSRVQVSRADVDAAREVLASPAPSVAIPEDLAEPPCPACASTNVAPEVWLSEASEAAPQQDAARSTDRRRIWYYVCGDCREAWPIAD